MTAPHRTPWEWARLATLSKSKGFILDETPTGYGVHNKKEGKLFIGYFEEVRDYLERQPYRTRP